MPEPTRRRPSPEQLLRQVEAEERQHVCGQLKVFLGYASGVGKSFRMLDEGRRRKERGQDVVVGAVQGESAPDVNALLQGFEVISPRKDLGSPAIDVEALIRRRPQVCLIDGLAYKNPPGSRHPERWQDVEALLTAGISVITTINLQYVAERQAAVEAIRGKKVANSVPEDFLLRADEIEVVDAPPEYCVPTAPDGSQAGAGEAEAVQQQLSALREIALVLAAEVVDHQLEAYLRRQGIELSYGTHERILVCITPRSNAEVMINRGKRQADRFHGELFVTYVRQDELSATDSEVLSKNLEFAGTAGAEVHVLEGEDPIGAIVEFAHKHGITQIFVGHSQQRGFWSRLRPNPVERLILEAEGIDVRIFPSTEAVVS